MGSGESKRRVVVEDADGEEIVTVGSLRALEIGAFSFVPLSEFVGRPSWTKSGP